MLNLNKFEIELLKRLSLKYPNIKKHISLLMVLNREITGVGMYINFGYKIENDSTPNLGIPDSTITTQEIIVIPGLESGLLYEVDITNNKINFIELVTYGEEWDGNIENYNFIKNE